MDIDLYLSLGRFLDAVVLSFLSGVFDHGNLKQTLFLSLRIYVWCVSGMPVVECL